jgi:hypothetical protein
VNASKALKSKRILLLILVAALAPLPPGAHGAQSRTVDLVNGSVDGRRILGRTVAGVTAVLGRPDFRHGNRRLYRIGWGTQTDFSMEVIFNRTNGALRAWSIVFARPPVRDARIGELLGRTSISLQAAVESMYADVFKLVRGYRCRAGSCVGEFAQRDGPLHLSFGTFPAHRTHLAVWIRQ